MTIRRTQDEELASLTQRLIRDLGASVPAEVVTTTVRAEYESLSATSRVPSFVPVLAERRARRRLAASGT